MYMGQAIGYKKEQQGRVWAFRLYQSYGGISRLCSGLCNIVTPRDPAKMMFDTYLTGSAPVFHGVPSICILALSSAPQLYAIIVRLDHWETRS